MNIINLEPEKAKKYKRLLDIDKTYWFTSISHDHELHNLLDSIPQNILDFIKNGPINLIISNECECFESVPLEIYKSIVIRGKIPERKILFLSGAGNITDIVSRIKDDINVKFGTGFTGFDSKFCGWYQYDLASLAKNRRSSNFKRNLALNGNVVYKKHFLLLNNRWRLHRPTIVGLLHAKNLLDYGYVSLGSNDQNFDWYNVFEQILNINRSNTLVCDLLESNKTKIQSLGYLDLDTPNYKEKTIVDEYSGRLDKYFETSFMSVVTETSFYNSETPFLTEKTFKPIIYRQPFILACVPGSLSFLRELGYKTFHPYIDESYDLERNDTERMWKIVTEIERICTLSSQELKGLSQELRDICNYNYNQLMSHGN